MLLLSLGMQQPALPDLLAKAQPVIATNGWTEWQATVGIYHWISPRSFVYITGRNGLEFPPMRHPDKTLHSYDLATGKSHVLQQLSWKVNELQLSVSRIATSPSGTRWLFGGAVDRHTQWFVFNLDGTQLASWQRDDEATAHDRMKWTWAKWADNNTICESKKANNLKSVRLIEHHLSDLAHPRSWVVRGETDKDLIIDPNYYTSSEAVWMIAYEGKAEFSARPLGKSGPERAWRVSMPPHTVFCDCTISTDRKRILWFLTSEPIYPNGQNSAPIYKKVSFWESPPSGPITHCIGEIRFKPGQEANEWQYLGGMEWNPDGKSFSFVYKRQLYLVKI